MKIKIKGAAAIEGIGLSNSALKHLRTLETELGLTAEHIRTEGGKSDAFATAVTVFLSEHARGKFITWDEAEQYTMGDVEYVLTKKEQAELDKALKARKETAEDAADPTVALTDSGQGDVLPADPETPAGS